MERELQLKKRRMKASSKATEGNQYYDYNLLVVVIFLTCFGLIMLYSSSAFAGQRIHGDDLHFFARQALFAGFGVVAMVVVSKIHYHIYAVFAREIFVISLLLLFVVWTPLGVEANGARRWIGLPAGLTFQPAELVKVSIIIIMAYDLCRQGKRTFSLIGAGKLLSLGLIASGLVLFLTSNLSTAIIIMGISLVQFFVVHPKTKPFLIAMGLSIGAAAIAVWYIVNQMYLSAAESGFRLWRIVAWRNPEEFASGRSFQLVQSLYAIGSGGFWGRGLGSSTQKLGVIPEVQNDMILAIVAEELGIFGVIVLLVLFAMLLYRLMFIAQNAPDLFSSLIVIGIFAHIALQVTLNVAVVTNLIPTTGVSLPFVSAGGTALAILLAELGIALNISRKIKIN